MEEETGFFISGLAGGMAQVLVGHPFDTVKVRLQTQTPGQYRNAMDCVHKTLRHENIFGLYKGISSPLIGIGFCNAILFSANGFFSNLLHSGDGNDPLPIGKVALSGGLSGMVMAFANAPIELLKVRLQIQSSSEKKLYSNIFDCAQQTFKSSGFKGLFRGLNATILRDIPSFAGYFAMYEAVRRQSADDSTLSMLFAGGMAGIAAWIPSYPQDVIKSKMQSRPNGHLSDTFLSAAREIYASRGFRGFFTGFGPTMMRAFPANAATFMTYEFVHRNFITNE